MRRRFGKIITELAAQDDKVVLLVGDIGFRVFDQFRDRFPDRFINMGICEQSMISVASGMALEGLKPWVYTITPFLIERPFEQVKLDIDQQKANVKLVGYADYPRLGPTHRELDALRLIQLCKNISPFFPKNGDDTEQSIYDSYKCNSPAFISLKKDPLLEESNT